MSSDIATSTPVPAPPSIGDAWWASPEVDEIDGHELVKDEALFALVGVPFMVTGVTFHDGIQRKGAPYRDDYASLEIRVAPSAAIASRVAAGRLTAENAAKVEPGEALVVNDGSTGLYRQIVQYLAAKELITLPEGAEAGEKGETIWDLPRSQWIAGGDRDGFVIALRCARGLRFSEYTNAYTQNEKARTWYLA